MQLVARALNINAKRIGQPLTGIGKRLGRSLGSYQVQSNRHYGSEHKTPTSGLERGHSAHDPLTGNLHHIPRDGQFSIVHAELPVRKPWQRKKNH